MSDEFKESEASQATCENCTAIHDAAHHYCPHCGAVSADGAETCSEHPRRAAVAHCVACEAPICEECARETEGRYVCENDVGAADTEPWAVMFSSAEEWEVEARRQLLDQSHIPAVRFAPGSWGPTATSEHELRVPPTREDEAREVLESAEFSLVDGDAEWEAGGKPDKGDSGGESVH